MFLFSVTYDFIISLFKRDIEIFLRLRLKCYYYVLKYMAVERNWRIARILYTRN